MGAINLIAAANFFLTLQTWFFTDLEDTAMAERTQGHLVVTNCSATHSRTALACKMAAEFDSFLKSHKRYPLLLHVQQYMLMQSEVLTFRWWCHFDDDNYVHISRLAHLLKSYDPSMPLYLGKPSTAKPLEIFDLKAPQV